MPYHDTLKMEATFVANIGLYTTGQKFGALYRGIITKWLPVLKGYIIDYKVVMEDIMKYIQGWFDETEYNTIYGLCGIGLHWMVCKMEKGGLPVPTTMVDWHNDINSDLSYDAFEIVVDLLDNLH